MTSSFIYGITFWASLQTDNVIWKVLNGLLIATSYFSDINNSRYYDEVDYFCILLISVCYLDFIVANSVLIAAAFIEAYFYKSIVIMKNVSFAIALCKCIAECFSKDIFVFFMLSWFSVIGITIYKIRLVHCEKNLDIVFYNFLTLLWRICSVFILISASFTLKKNL